MNYKELISNIFNDKYFPFYFILFLIWMIWGIFPLTSYESDSTSIIAGCEIMNNQGWSLPPLYSYEYNMQPLITILIVSLKKIFSFLSCEQIYCLTTALFSISFILGTIQFVNLITGTGKTKILLALFLLPESYAISMYPNSTIFAATFFIWSLFYILKGKQIHSLILLIIAPLFRLDIVSVYPAIFPLFYFINSSLKNSFLKSLYVAIIITASSFILYYILHTDLLNTLNSYKAWNETVTGSSIKLAIAGFYGIFYLLLIPIGLFHIISRKAYKILFLVAVPIISLHIVYMSMGCASKHYMYLIPFCAIIGVYALNILNRLSAHYLTIRVLLLFFTFFYLFGSVKIDLYFRPWKNSPKSMTKEAPCLNITSINKGLNKFNLGIGAGQIIPTFDEIMIATGVSFYPSFIHNLKVRQINYFNEIKTYFNDKNNYIILSYGWNSLFHYPLILLENGYNFSNTRNIFTYTKGDNKVTNIFNGNQFDTDVPNETALQTLYNQTRNKYGNNNIYILILDDHDIYTLEHISKESKSITKINDILFKINM